MISAPDRRQAIGLIREACQDGARLKRACAELGIDVRTYQRWRGSAPVKADARPGTLRPEPVNKLSAEERAQVLALCHAPAYASLPPGQIVPRLADQGEYMASESSFYRILREADQHHHRGAAVRRGRQRNRHGWWHEPPTRCGPGISLGCPDQSRGCFSTST